MSPRESNSSPAETSPERRPAAQEPQSWLSRNRQLLAKNPRLFFRKAATWLKPMRKDYRRRWSPSLATWLRRYQTDLVFSKVSWMGVPAWKNVLDAWVYQQIIYQTRPELVIEIGNAYGGGTLYLAHLLDLVGQGEILAVDIDHSKFMVKHPRITQVTGDSADPHTLRRVEELARGRQGLVIHDGDHTRDHVLGDLRAYCGYVRKGSYLVVEDTISDLFRAGDGIGNIDGPLPAVEQFLREDPRFVIDSEPEFFVLTYNPRGYLRRTS
jgi:cephalosporin hydroxylase